MPGHRARQEGYKHVRLSANAVELRRFKVLFVACNWLTIQQTNYLTDLLYSFSATNITLDTNYTSMEVGGDEEEEEEEEEEFVDGEVEGEEEYDMNEEEDMYDEDDTEFFNTG